MIIGTFLFYLALFLFLFTSKKKIESHGYRRALFLPAVFALLLAIVGALKVYFVYKILFLLLIAFLSLLSYWQWKEKIRRWLP